MTITDTTPAGTRGGRPRDPAMAARILDAVITFMAERGATGWTMDDLAAECSVGKASIYRRWRTFDAILAEAVARLGVRSVDYGDGLGTLRGDLHRLLTAATVGRDAAATRATIAVLAQRPELRTAYLAGPEARLRDAIAEAQSRSIARGGEIWPTSLCLWAGIALLREEATTAGFDPEPEEIGSVIEAVVLAGEGTIR